MSVDARQLLRAGVLEGVNVAVAAAQSSGDGAAAASVRSEAAQLGAQVASVALSGEPDAEREEQAAVAAMAAALGQLGSLQSLVIDVASLFEGRDGRAALTGSLAACWNAARAAAQLAFLPAQAGGRIVLIGPTGGAELAAPTVAALENLARTLSIEWARHRITTVAVAPGAGTTRSELAALTCYLLSSAGAYFSGCLMDLRGPQGA
jgi:NAD(P)-dependent dehydrogenase (short-subunit alcohol dehydrogenase family)